MNRHKSLSRIIGLISVTLLLSACGVLEPQPTLTPTPMPTPTPTTGRITGKVPSRGEVDLYEAMAPEQQVFPIPLAPGFLTTSTDLSGSFSIDNVEPGKYQIKFTLDLRPASFEFPDIGAPWTAADVKITSPSGKMTFGAIVMSSEFEVEAGDVLRIEIE